MICSICGAGQMVKKRLDVDKAWKGRTITFRGIEAEVCESCGSKVYKASDVAMMESLIESTLNKADYPEVMNVEEVSQFLRVTPQTIYNMLRDGRIVATKVGREWRFPKESILRIFDPLMPAAACYRSSAGGADKAREEIEKFTAELQEETESKQEKRKE